MIKSLILAAVTILLLSFYRFRLMLNLAIFFVMLWLALFMTSLSYSYYKNISTNEWKVMNAWVGSYFYLGRREYHEITYPSKFGFEKTVKIEVFEKDEYVDEVLFRFTELFKRNMCLSLLNEIVGIIALFVYFKLKAEWRYDGLYKELPSGSHYSYRSETEHILIKLYRKVKAQLKQEELHESKKVDLANIESQNIEKSKAKIKTKEILDIVDMVDSKNLAELSNSAKTTNNSTLNVTEQIAIIKHPDIFKEDD